VHLPGLAFVLSAVLLAVGTVIAARVTAHTAPLASSADAPMSDASRAGVPDALPHDSSH
jgi:DHA1 family tetracycline resistance protein-like MFS transporter